MAIIIEMPKLSDTMTVGTLTKWLKKEGEKIGSGDKLAEVETDKATMELENFDEGVLLRYYVQPGQEVPVGAPICAIGEPGEPVPERPSVSAATKLAMPPPPPASERSTGLKKEIDEVTLPCVPEVKAEPTVACPSLTSVVAPPGSPADRIKASPLAKKMANEAQVDLKLVKGTGPGGRILAEDVEKAAAKLRAAAAAPSPSPKAVAAVVTPVTPSGVTQPLPSTDLPISNIRKIIAQRLVESKTTIPHFYLEMEIDAVPLLDLRASLNQALGELPPEQGGIKLTVNDFILKASATALMKVPVVNRSWVNDTIRQHGTVNLAFGVAIEDGLVTPVIRDAQQKTLRQIAEEAKDLIGKARAKKLGPAEMSGSTFTVTNLGMYGISSFYGIINPPNAAILSVGTTIKKPVVDDQDRIIVGQRMTLGISCDHRVVDGAAGAELLLALKRLLENPVLLLV